MTSKQPKVLIVAVPEGRISSTRPAPISRRHITTDRRKRSWKKNIISTATITG